MHSGRSGQRFQFRLSSIRYDSVFGVGEIQPLIIDHAAQGITLGYEMDRKIDEQSSPS